MSSRVRRALFAGLLAVQCLGGCVSWEIVPLTPRLLADSTQWKAVQLRESGGVPFVLEAPRVEGDSVRGRTTRTIKGNRTTGEASRTVSEMRAVALTSIDQVAVRRFNGEGVALLVVIPLLALGVIAAASCGSSGYVC